MVFELGRFSKFLFLRNFHHYKKLIWLQLSLLCCFYYVFPFPSHTCTFGATKTKSITFYNFNLSTCLGSIISNLHYYHICVSTLITFVYHFFITWCISAFIVTFYVSISLTHTPVLVNTHSELASFASAMVSLVLIANLCLSLLWGFSFCCQLLHQATYFPIGLMNLFLSIRYNLPSLTRGYCEQGRRGRELWVFMHLYFV